MRGHSWICDIDKWVLSLAGEIGDPSPTMNFVFTKELERKAPKTPGC